MNLAQLNLDNYVSCKMSEISIIKDVIIPLQPLNDLRDTLTLYNTKAHQEHDGKNLLQTVKDMFTVVEAFFAMHVLRNTVD